MSEAYLTTSEVAERFRTVESTVRFWRMKGFGPKSVKVGRKLLFPIAEVDGFEAALLAGLVEPPPESPTEDNPLAALVADRDEWKARALKAERALARFNRLLAAANADDSEDGAS